MTSLTEKDLENRKLDRQVPRKPRLVGRGKGHNFKSISLLTFRSPLRAPGSPFDILRALSSVERPRPVAGELHYFRESRSEKHLKDIVR